MNSIKNIREIIGTAPIFMPAAGIILYQDGKILLQKRGDDGKWALHGGAMEMGETTQETAMREAIEEIGITPIALDFYGVFSGPRMYHIYPDGNEVYFITTVYFCDKYTGQIKIDENEVIAVEWFEINKLPNNIGSIDAYILEQLRQYVDIKYS